MDSFKRYYGATFILHRKLLVYLGHDLYDWNFKPGLATFLIYFFVAIVILLLTYTMIFYDNFTRLNCILYYGFCVQVSDKE